MKKWLLYLFLLSFFTNAFTQEKQEEASSQDSVENKTPNMAEIATELEKTGALVEVTNSTSQELKEPESISPDIDSLLSDGRSSLIQYDAENFSNKIDPYPLESYQGEFLTDIDEIKKSFLLENIQQVKASLERLYQNNKSTFPIEGYLMLAAIYDQLQNYRQSKLILDEGELLVEDAKKGVFQLNKATVLRHSGENQASLDILNQLGMNILTQYPEIYFDKGLSYLYLKKDDLAILNFRKYVNLLPNGAQNAKVRRAIAWLILSKSNKLSPSLGSKDVPSASSREQDLEKMLQLLVDKQLTDQVGDLIKSTSTNVDTKALDIQEKELEDLAEYSSIAD